MVLFIRKSYIRMLILWSPVLQGSWCGDSCVVMDNHTLHTVANGGDAWDDPWEKVWQVPWVGAACLWGEAGSLDCGATATDMWSWSGHCVHGHWRKITAENPWPCVPTQKTLQKHQDHFIMIFGSVHFVLSHLPNFNAISGISLAAAIMSLR